MKRWLKAIAVLGVGLAATSAGADDADDVTPFLGVDYYHAYMKGRNSWNSIFPNSYPGGTFYVGTKFHQYFGLELGYDWSLKQKKEWALPAGSNFFGTVQQSISGTTKVQRSGGHLDVVGYLPVAESVELIGSLGFGWIQTKIQTTFDVVPGATVEGSSLASVSGKGRGVFRVGVGANYMLTDIVGMRAKVGWESTSTLRIEGNQTFTAAQYDTKAFKGTTALAVGLFVKF